MSDQIDAPHATAAELDAYVVGSLEGAEAMRLEDHAAVCDRCARALENAAALEQTLAQAARALEPRRPDAWSTKAELPARSRSTARRAAFVAMAVAASLLLAVALTTSRGRSNDVRMPTAPQLSLNAAPSVASLEAAPLAMNRAPPRMAPDEDPRALVDEPMFEPSAHSIQRRMDGAPFSLSLENPGAMP